MARNAALPIVTAEPGLTHYLEEIRRFPMLERQEEYLLAKRWREHGDRDAAHKLVTSHLRLVTKIARDYRGYGLPISEAISEGNVGLVRAVERFEPQKGFTLAYAVWWIKAAIQEFILRSWSLVKMGTTASQRKLFFNLRKAKSKISALDEGDMRPNQVTLIAKQLGVTETDVINAAPPGQVGQLILTWLTILPLGEITKRLAGPVGAPGFPGMIVLKPKLGT